MISEAELMELSFPNAPQDAHERPWTQSGRAHGGVGQVRGLHSRRRRVSRHPPEGMGATAKDADGNLYIDMAAGVAVNAVGRGHPKILEAINRQCGVIMHTTDITNPKRIEPAKKVSGVMPEGLRGDCHTSFFQAGSDAVETAIKFSRQRPAAVRSSPSRARTTACGAVPRPSPPATTTGTAGGRSLPACSTCPTPTAIGAFNMTYPTATSSAPSMWTTSSTPPTRPPTTLPRSLWRLSRAKAATWRRRRSSSRSSKPRARRYGCLYVADEVQSGAGRTGKMWCIEYWGVSPTCSRGARAWAGTYPWPASPTGRRSRRACPRITAHHLRGERYGVRSLLTNIDLIQTPMDLLGRARSWGEQIKGKLTDAMDREVHR